MRNGLQPITDLTLTCCPLPEELGVDILPELLQEEPVSYVAAAEHSVHQSTVIDLDLNGEGSHLGQGDGGDPVDDVEAGENKEEHVPEVEDKENLQDDK